MGYSKKPCPGCGKPGYRETGLVCHECKKKIEFAESMFDKIESRAKTAKGEGDIIEIAWASHFLLPYAYHSGSDATHKFNRAFYDLLVLLSIPTSHSAFQHGVTKDLIVQDFSHDTSSKTLAILPTEAANLFRLLDEAFRDGTEHAYQEGFKDGRSLISGLADGTLSVEQFESRIDKKEKK